MNVIEAVSTRYLMFWRGTYIQRSFVGSLIYLKKFNNMPTRTFHPRRK